MRIRLFLIALAILPATVLAVSEYVSFRESEALIGETYERQVETILYSINQNGWDVVNNWVNDLETSLLLNQKPEVLLRSEALTDVLTEPELTAAGVTAAQKRQAAEQLRNGYRRLDVLNTDAAEGIIIWFPLKKQGGTVEIGGLRIHKDRFIRDEMAGALELAALQGLTLGLFRTGETNPVFATAPMLNPEATMRKPFWIFPDVELAVSLRGESLESMARKRMVRSLILLALITGLLLTGMWVVYRNVSKEAELARLKSDFVANVSHELKTPVSLIRMFAETLESGRMNDEQRKMEYYRVIHRETQRLTHLINTILNFARMDAGRREYRLSPHSLNRIVDEVMQTYAWIFQEHGFTVDTRLQEDLPHTLLDAESVAEAVLNLIDNAIKYSTDKKYIQIRTWMDGTTICLSVTDEGIGISPDDQPRIFEKFFRVSGTLVQETKGAGLGLSLVKHIAEGHYGSIGVYSQPGKGSTFTLTFPYRNAGVETGEPV